MAFRYQFRVQLADQTERVVVVDADRFPDAERGMINHIGPDNIHPTKFWRLESTTDPAIKLDKET